MYNVAIPMDWNVEQKEGEKKLKYKSLWIWDTMNGEL